MGRFVKTKLTLNSTLTHPSFEVLLKFDDVSLGFVMEGVVINGAAVDSGALLTSVLLSFDSEITAELMKRKKINDLFHTL